MLMRRFHKKALFYFIYCSQSPKMFCPYFYTCVFICHLGGSFEPRSHFISGYNIIFGVSVILNIIGLLLTPTKMILGYSLSQFCFEPLWPIFHTIKWSICSLISSYDTTMEQIFVIRQLMELYIIQDDEFHYGSVMLELGVALHGLGDKDLEVEK